MLAGALNRFAPSTYGRLSPAVAVTISCSRSGLRWSSISNHVDADNCSAAAKPLSAMPYPNGALPLLGHQLLLRKHNKNISNLFDHYFGELGPIYRMKLPAGEYSDSPVHWIVLVRSRWELDCVVLLCMKQENILSWELCLVNNNLALALSSNYPCKISGRILEGNVSRKTPYFAVF